MMQKYVGESAINEFMYVSSMPFDNERQRTGTPKTCPFVSAKWTSTVLSPYGGSFSLCSATFNQQEN